MIFAPQTVAIWLIFLAAAILEVGGDALVRKGLLGKSAGLILTGMAVLGFYGVLVNTVKWDFSKLLGVYVGFFAVVSILWGRFLLHEKVPLNTWIGLAVIVGGGMIIQFGGPR